MWKPLLLITPLLLLSSPSLAREQGGHAPVAGEKPFQVPYNSVLATRLTGMGAAGDRAISGEFRAVIFRQSRHLCYQATLSGLGEASAIQLGRGLPGGQGTPLFLLSALGDGKSGACVKLPRKLATSLINYPLLMYVQVATSAYPRGAARGQLLRVAQNTSVDDMQAPFSAPIPSREASFAGG